MLKLQQLFSNARHQLGLLALLPLLLAPLAAHADGRDTVHFGENITIQQGDETHDAVCFLCSIEVDGTVHGDTVAFLGNVHVRGAAEHDVVVFLGNITLADNASIGHDMVVFAGSFHAGTGATVGKDRVVFPAFILFVPILIAVGIVALILWGISSLVTRNRPIYPMPPPRY